MMNLEFGYFDVGTKIDEQNNNPALQKHTEFSKFNATHIHSLEV